MLSFRTLLSRHALRLSLLLAGAAAFLVAPPALASGLPGSGLWPRIAGAGLVICALFPGRMQTAGKKPSAQAFRRALGLVAACLLWMALLNYAGALLSTFLSALLACRAAGCSLKESLVLCAILVAALWLGMEHLLDYSLPQGALFSPDPGA